MEVDWRSVVGGGLILIPAVSFGIFGNAAEMGAVTIAGVLAATFLNIDRFEKFKAAGFEGKLKEAKETADKALVTLESLEAVIEPLLISTLANITHINRIGGMTQSEKDLIRDKCVLVKSSLFPNNTEISEFISQYDNYSKWDAYSEITNHLFGENGNSTKAVYNELYEKQDRSSKIFPKEQDIINVFEKHDVQIDDKLKGIITNYLSKIEHNESPS